MPHERKGSENALKIMIELKELRNGELKLKLLKRPSFIQKNLIQILSLCVNSTTIHTQLTVQML